MDITDYGHKLTLDGGQGRSSGIHVSAILRLIGAKMGFIKRRDSVDDADRASFSYDSVLRMSLGLAWEDWLARTIPGLEYHFGELEVDGILMTPDGYDPNTDRVHEFKLTWKSSARPIREEWMWLAQLKAYCKGMRCTEGVLHAYHVMGDYKGFTPAYPSYLVRFTQEEIDANWNLIIRHKDEATPESH